MPVKTIAALGEVGINKDAQPQELKENAWSNGANVRFRNGAMERMKGEQKVFDAPVVTPYYLQQYSQGGNSWWIHAGTNAIYADNGTIRTNITPVVTPSGTVDNRWTGGVLGGIAYLNNGVNPPVSWTGTGIAAPLTAWPANTTCMSLRPYKSFLVALNVTKSGVNYPHMVKWSNAAVPGAIPDSWDPNDKTKLAGEVDVAEESSILVDQLPLGDVNILYKENAMYAMSLTGTNDPVFRFQRLPGSVGMLARGCAVNTEVGHVVLAFGDVVIHQGQGPKSIINGRLRSWLFRTIDTTNRKRAFLVANPPAKEVWVCFPDLGATSCTLAAVWNWVDDTWSIRNLNNVNYGATGQLSATATTKWSDQNYAWQDATQAWDEDELTPAQERLLLAAQTPLITAADVTGTINGASYTSYVERIGLSMGDPGRQKLCRGMRLRVDAARGTRIQVEIGGHNNPEQPVTWSPPVVYSVQTGQYNQIDSFASGRFLAFRITSLDNQPWRITSQDVDLVLQGSY